MILIIAFLVVLIFGAYLLTNQEAAIQDQSEECLIENPDPDGYLLKICRYLRAHEDTIFPKAPPMITPIAKSTTLPFKANFLNSLNKPTLQTPLLFIFIIFKLY